MSPRKSPAPPQNRALRNHTSANKDTAPESDFDFDRRVVDQVDWSLWRAVFEGHFRLAVRCDVCGRWLTDGRSKRKHRGPRCAAKAVGE